MTCIVGFQTPTGVIIGGDSAGSNEHHISVRADAKVFERGPFLYGITSSFRMGNLLRYAFDPPEALASESVEQYMHTRWLDALRRCFKDGGYARTHEGQESGGFFLVGYRGRLFCVESDYQLAQGADPFAAVGSGMYYALGCLHAFVGSNVEPVHRVERALQAAAYFDPFVRAPFVLIGQDRPAGT
jgi:hypothetical protein